MQNEIRTKIVGVSFGNRQELIKELEVDEVLYLKPEPGNEYDPNAIAVRSYQGQIGYLSRELAAQLKEAVSQGARYVCVVTAITGKDYGSHLGVNVVIRRVEDG